jgi:hypothetical protein
MSEGSKDESPEGVTAKAARFFRTFGFIVFPQLDISDKYFVISAQDFMINHQLFTISHQKGAAVHHQRTLTRK